ncbi:MAG: dihydropteroate synthase [Candidatus Thorarchaeota archaeon]
MTWFEAKSATFYVLLFSLTLEECPLVKHIVDLEGLRIGEGYPVRLMGILNLSPESFYKDTTVSEKASIQQLVEKMDKDGVDIIDIGAVSTAPSDIYGTPMVSEKEEISRVKNALGYVTDVTNLPLSIDTVSSKVAETALDMGVSMVNDVSGLRSDSKMVELVRVKDIPIVIMANCGSPCESISTVLQSLEESYAIAISSGIEEDKIIIDPGIGFGKPAEVDLEILGRLQQFTRFNQPLLVGVSRKAFIGSLLNLEDPAKRLNGSLAATTIAVYNGANVIRTHDVMETRMAVQIGEAILQQVSER